MKVNLWWISLLGVSTLGWATVGVVHPRAHIADVKSIAPQDIRLHSGEVKQNELTRASVTEMAKTARPPNVTKAANCPADMVEVEGEHCQTAAQYCKEYISEKRDRCASFRNQVRCLGKTKKLHTCIDRYEYPNRAGAKPTVAITFIEAAELCAAEGKRLCTADEWTQACEGPEHLPYPYGFVRNNEICNHDKPYRIPNDNAYANRATRAAEVARLDQSEPSGSRTGCVSAYGVFDMTGNVDEWVINESGTFNGPAYESGLKGGYWGPVRNRCRPMTTDHNRWHSGYQIGVRCCKTPGNTIKSPNAPNAANATVTDVPLVPSTRDLSRS